jgi:Subtilisin inhibitor-like
MSMKPEMFRMRTGARYLLIPLIAVACAAAVTACGSTPAPSGAAAPGGTTPTVPKVSLDITVSTTPGAPSKHWTLRCDPAGGTHPDPAAACAVLLKAKAPFAPLPKGIMCPMIRVGTKTAIVKGTYFGRHVDTRFMPGGCGLAQWEQIGPIFN